MHVVGGVMGMGLLGMRGIVIMVMRVSVIMQRDLLGLPQARIMGTRIERRHQHQRRQQ